jgi:hypothetical protein
MTLPEYLRRVGPHRVFPPEHMHITWADVVGGDKMHKLTIETEYVRKQAAQSETAFRTIVWNTGRTSVGEAHITRRISAVAARCSSASSRSRITWPSCSWGWSVDTCAVSVLRALGLLECLPFTGFPLPPRRCMSPPPRVTTMLNPMQIPAFAP